MRKKRSGKNKDKFNIFAYLILIGFGIMVVFLVISPLRPTESYAFCEKLRNLDNNADKYVELKRQIKNLCDTGRLTQTEQELGDLGVGFIEDLSIFDANWKNESIAREYAKKIDDNTLKIRGIRGVNSSKIPPLVDSLYVAKVGNLSAELDIQNMDIINITSSTEQLENENSTLTVKMKIMRDEEENKTKKLETLSLAYNQKKNESEGIESNLSLARSEYEKVKNSLIDTLFPPLLIGVLIGGIIGLVLSLKWKKEKSYWDAYSSSAKVKSPLKLATLLTVALLVTLLLYLFLSGELEVILAG